MSGTFKELMLDVHDGVATITFNRPEARNPLGGLMREEFAAAVAEVSGMAGETVHAVILTGNGPAFCAGGDIKVLREMTEKGRDAMRARMKESHITLKRWLDLPVPTIAAVNGAAAGAGFSLAIASDFVVASPRAKFVMSFGKIGLVPDWGAMHLLPRLVGLQRARELVLTARMVGVEEAHDLGLVLEITGEDDLLDRAAALAHRFRDASPKAIGLAKKIMGSAFETPLQDALDAEADAQADANDSAYHRAALDRFLAKEAPLFDWDCKDS